MLYNSLSVAVPAEKRSEYNRKVLQLIQSGNLQGITPEEIFNIYTGKGGLHGLRRADFPHYHAYSRAKKMVEQGQFFTPHMLCAQIVEALRPPAGYNVVDLTCGVGVFFNYMPEGCSLYGNELDHEAYTVCKFLYPHVTLTHGDMLDYDADVPFDLVIGNPPFHLQTREGTSHMAYLKKSAQLLNPDGLIAVIVPASFLADSFHDRQQIEWVNDHYNFILQSLLPSNTFSVGIEIKLLMLQRKGVTENGKPYDPLQFEPFSPTVIYENFTRPLQEQYRADAAKRHLYNVRRTINDSDTAYQIKKWLWQIKTSSLLKKTYYSKALHKLHQLNTQQKPDGMDDRKWEATRLTPEKVLQYLKRIVQRQNDPAPVLKTQIVKGRYAIRNKAYHSQLRGQEWETPIYELVASADQPPAFVGLIARKRKAYQLQSVPFDAMPRNNHLDACLQALTLTPAPVPGQLFAKDGPTIRLTEMQRHDLGLAFQKPYSLLSWEQGSGKSVAGMAWISLYHTTVRNIFLLAPALAIEATWERCLDLYGFEFMRVTSITDTYKITPGKIVLLSYEAVSGLQRFVKKYVRRSSYKIGLLVDESDELSNPGSQRTKAALNCFRKAKRKLLTTGTTTRNHIGELYSQLELLYNNSYNMICHGQHYYHTNKENKLEEDINPYYGRPFPGFRGNALFRACFCPQRSTVFGIRRDEQDVYNPNALRDLIAKTIICRRFSEVAGEKKHEIILHYVDQQPAEQKLYEVLLYSFLEVCYDYFTSTGNTRKEAGLRLARQIRILIKATSVPHLMKNYEGDQLPAKYFEVCRLLREWPDQIVTIGCTLKSASQNYYKHLQQEFPYRQIFHINGEATIAKRVKVLQDLERSRNGILVCTQQSLKSSVNIPFCSRCIVESLQWNMPKISQFYFRFIRFNSQGHAQIHFITNNGTIEYNLLALLMAKEKLNEFVKTGTESTFDSLFEKYGIDAELLEALIQKEYDEDGKLYLRWGTQRFHRQ
ncbi:putative RNA methylase [Chitinophaga terrae (ex Kim and Jung 2007)]|uniref:N-6 DNA methylase n=1 Tax=Chitinophaga terrae (ex Kim and Jung 2007) TaxID=408074 RepID=UPI00277D58E4|nr:N-6 DNA methylase [Chitinophaga terrae (ex Kim and Jung 2007)]MDQ0107479.1 putative RNA methylase [Chitinophaga terrae (ex Kim and Jung 2007)]